MARIGDDINEQSISKVNSGGLINLRVHNLWVDRHKWAAKGQYNKWNEVLDAIWCELGADVKEDSPEDKEFWKLSQQYAEACGTPKKKNGFNQPTKDDRVSMAKQKVTLIKKELFLRRLQNKQGKGTAYLDEDDFD